MTVQHQPFNQLTNSRQLSLLPGSRVEASQRTSAHFGQLRVQVCSHPLRTSYNADMSESCGYDTAARPFVDTDVSQIVNLTPCTYLYVLLWMIDVRKDVHVLLTVHVSVVVSCIFVSCPLIARVVPVRYTSVSIL